MGNPRKSLLKIFVDECRQCLIDYSTPLIAFARWIRRHTRK
jgi:hypothetical protein